MSDDALLAAGWQPIATYPREYLRQEEVYWGPPVVVLVPPTDEFPYGYVPLIAHLEADLWLARDSVEPWAWGSLYAEPKYWLPLPPYSEADLASKAPFAR